MPAMQRLVQRLQSGPTVFRNATSLRTHLRLMPRVRRACATLRRAIVSEIRYSIVVSAHLAARAVSAAASSMSSARTAVSASTVTTSPCTSRKPPEA